MKKSRNELLISLVFLTMLVVWTVAAKFVDVRPIGPNGSCVGLASVNGFVHELFGVHMLLYYVTDWLGLVPLFIAVGFAVSGLVQWIKRRNILKVDADILVLGLFYIAVIAVFLLFERIALNYRPILINGILEASYPSSTTLLVMCVMPTTAMQIKWRMKTSVIKKLVLICIYLFTAFMVIGRLVSGVHWFSDIIAGALTSVWLVTMYHYLLIERKVS